MVGLSLDSGLEEAPRLVNLPILGGEDAQVHERGNVFRIEPQRMTIGFFGLSMSPLARQVVGEVVVQTGIVGAHFDRAAE